eukprot:scaffold674_cov126-Cylindrotheca_fusiformis.AAC.16
MHGRRMGKERLLASIVGRRKPKNPKEFFAPLKGKFLLDIHVFSSYRASPSMRHGISLDKSAEQDRIDCSRNGKEERKNEANQHWDYIKTRLQLVGNGRVGVELPSTAITTLT